MPEPRAFTNIPGQPGEYAPAAPWWEGPAQVRPEAREEATTFPGPPTIGEGYMTPDYSNRSLFEKYVFGEIGGNPFELNPREALQFADENLPDLFERFFQGTVVWEDREKLTKNQADQWDEVVRSYHAWALKEAEMQKTVMTDQYTFMMGQFDTAAKEYQEALTKVRKRREAVAKLKRTQEKAAEPKEVSTIDIKRGFDMLKDLQKALQEKRISKGMVESYNMLAEKTGAPRYIIEETEVDPHWIERAYDFFARRETEIKKKVELKKKPPEKPAEAKKRPAPKATKAPPRRPGATPEKMHLIERRKTPDGRIIGKFWNGTKYVYREVS